MKGICSRCHEYADGSWERFDFVCDECDAEFAEVDALRGMEVG